jgi:hypothetical protein
MKAASALAAILFLTSLPLHGQTRDEALIRAVKEIPANALDPTLPGNGGSLPFSRFLAIMTRVPIAALQWEVNDCGEGGDGRKAPTCVEVHAELAPDTSVSVSVSVLDTNGNPGPPGLFMMSVKKGSSETSVKSLRELSLPLNVQMQMAPAPPRDDAATGITGITLERTPCYGSCPVDTLELRVDGTALYTGKENTDRIGQFTGTLQKREFDKLALWLVTEGVFELNTSYGTPNVDSPAQVIRIVRGGKSKWVVNNSMDRSLQVLAMERVILAVSEVIEWQPSKSGIRGVATWRPPGEAWRPLPNQLIRIYQPGDEHEFKIHTDADGRFEIKLVAGTYTVEPLIFGVAPQQATPARTNPRQTVIVQPSRFADASFKFDRAAGNTTISEGVSAN